jgi:hypothetical protein
MERDHIARCLPGKLPEDFAQHVNPYAMTRLDTLGPLIVRVQIGLVAAEQVAHLLKSVDLYIIEVVDVYKASVEAIKADLPSYLRTSNPSG